MSDSPIWCARCAIDNGIAVAAGYEVTGKGKGEVVCGDHLAASKRWAGEQAVVKTLKGSGLFDVSVARGEVGRR